MSDLDSDQIPFEEISLEETSLEEGEKVVVPHKMIRHFKRLGRELAMQFLYECELAGKDELAESLANFFLQAEESGKFVTGRLFVKGEKYAQKLIAGVLLNEEEIDSLLQQFSEKWDMKRMPLVDKNIMRVAVYEMKYCPDIPILVSINEAIEISKEFGTEKSSFFINGILNGVKSVLPAESNREKD